MARQTTPRPTERRGIPSARMQAESDGKIRGCVVPFNSASEILFSRTQGHYREIVKPGAFAKTLKEKPDVVAIWNHNSDIVLGRTKAGTLRLWESESGLEMINEPPDGAADKVESIRRGDATNTSFMFSAIKDRWLDGDEPGVRVRELIEVELFEVSLGVVFPAYQDTEVFVRSALLNAGADEKEIARALGALHVEHKPERRDIDLTERGIRLEKRAAEDGGEAVADFYIYDVIWPWGEGSAQSIARQLEELGDLDRINVYINSPGGDAFGGVAIYNLLKRNNAKVATFVDGEAASAASIIFEAGDKGLRTVGAGGELMIHNALAGVIGNANFMRKVADDLEKMSLDIADIYAANGSKTQTEFKALMDEETWLTGAEAVAAGLADHVVSASAEDEERTAKHIAQDLESRDYNFGYRNIPERITKHMERKQPEPGESPHLVKDQRGAEPVDNTPHSEDKKPQHKRPGWRAQNVKNVAQSLREWAEAHQ